MAGRNRIRQTDPSQTVKRATEDRRGFINQSDIVALRRSGQVLGYTADAIHRVDREPHEMEQLEIQPDVGSFPLTILGYAGEGRILVNVADVGIPDEGEPSILTMHLLNGMNLVFWSTDAFLSGDSTVAINGLTGDITTIGDIAADGDIEADGALIASSLISGGLPVRTKDERWFSGAHHDPGATTVSVIGTTAWTLDGTLASNDDANGSRLNCQTTNVSGNVAGVTGPANYRADWGIDASFRASVVDTTNVRLWVALASNTVSGSDTPSVQGAGFRYSTSVPDTNWVCYTRGSGSGTTTDSGVAVSAGTYVFRMVLDGAQVLFYINGTLVATHTTNLPTATSLLAPRVRATTLTNAAKNVGYGVFFAESK